MDSSSRSSGGVQHRRRTVSGESRFSTGKRCSSAIAATAVRLAARRPAASGSRSGHDRAGGGASLGSEVGGRSLSGSAYDSSSAAYQRSACRRAPRPANPWTVSRVSRDFGRARAASTIAVSARTRPGAASRCWASWSRAFQRERTAARPREPRTRCSPEVRRQGSTRGAGPGDGQHRRELLLGPLELALLGELGVRWRRAARRGPRRRARRSAATARAAAGSTSRLPSDPSPGPGRGPPRRAARDRLGRVRPGVRRARCRRSAGGRMPMSREAGQVLARGVQHPLGVGEGGVQRAEVGAADRVDEGGPGTDASELDEIGALPVAVARGALGVDGHRSAARGEGRDGLRRVARRPRRRAEGRLGARAAGSVRGVRRRRPQRRSPRPRSQGPSLGRASARCVLRRTRLPDCVSVELPGRRSREWRASG